MRGDAAYFYKDLPEDVSQKIRYMPTVQEMLEFSYKSYGQQPAISDGAQTFTYEELFKNIACRRTFLYQTGIPEDSHIALLCKNDRHAAELFLGIITAGYRLVVLPNSLDAKAAASICKKFDIRGVFVSKEFQAVVKDSAVPVFPVTSTAETESDMKTAAPERQAALFFTGGTTGSPKGAMLSHGALMQGAFYGCHLGMPFWNRRGVMILPLSHIFGAVVGFLSMLYTGALLYTSEDMYKSLMSLAKIRPTNLLLVPGLLETLLSIADAKGEQILGGLSSVTVGGAPMAPFVAERSAAYGIKVSFGYGMTENASVVSVNYDCDLKPGSVGRLFMGQELRIEEGEIQLKGNNLMSGYYGDTEATEQAFQDGWLRTGDAGRVDKDGYLYITGRIKNLIILSNGENVCPEEIEQLVSQDPLVCECIASETEVNGKCVIGIEIYPDQEAQKQRSADDVETYLRRYIEEVNRTLPSFKRISAVSFRREPFPKNRAMKIVRGN